MNASRYREMAAAVAEHISDRLTDLPEDATETPAVAVTLGAAIAGDLHPETVDPEWQARFLRAFAERLTDQADELEARHGRCVVFDDDGRGYDLADLTQ